MHTKPDCDHLMTSSEPHAKRLAELEGFEHLLFEPMTQTDLDRLYALSERWTEQLGDSPKAIARCALQADPDGERSSPRPIPE